MFIENISTEVALYLILYGAMGMAGGIIAVYLLLRRGNAFAKDVTPPLRLRRWAAAFYAATMLSHVWWFLFYFISNEVFSVAHIVTAMLDVITLTVTITGTQLAMLQDRRRPVWPVLVAAVPFAVVGTAFILHPTDLLVRIFIGYFLTVYVLFAVYIFFALRQYRRWLYDNYADLENKRIWLSLVLFLGILLLFVLYAFENGSLAISYASVAIQSVIFTLLLWRIETLPKLGDAPVAEASQAAQPPICKEQRAAAAITANIDVDNMERLLEEHCRATALYLQHDLTVTQLAKAIGTNRFYLSQYFTSKGTTYNAYINDLRIRHFVSRYRETVATGQPVTAQQLAKDSGYRSYSTFSLAFKQRMGQSVTAWIHEPPALPAQPDAASAQH